MSVLSMLCVWLTSFVPEFVIEEYVDVIIGGDLWAPPRTASFLSSTTNLGERGLRFRLCVYVYVCKCVYLYYYICGCVAIFMQLYEPQTSHRALITVFTASADPSE